MLLPWRTRPVLPMYELAPEKIPYTACSPASLLCVNPSPRACSCSRTKLVAPSNMSANRTHERRDRTHLCSAPRALHHIIPRFCIFAPPSHKHRTFRVQTTVERSDVMRAILRLWSFPLSPFELRLSETRKSSHQVRRVSTGGSTTAEYSMQVRCRMELASSGSSTPALKHPLRSWRARSARGPLKHGHDSRR